MRLTLAIGTALAVLTGPLAAQQQQLEVSLDEAVRRALQIQPDMVQARGEQRTSAAGRRSALGAFLPSVTTSWSASRSNVGRIDQTTGQLVPPEYTHTVGLNANVTLFDGLNRFGTLRAAGAEQDAAEAGFVSQRYQTTLATKQVFYNALAREDLVRVAEAQVRRAEQQLQISIEKLRAGSATRSDSLRATVEHGNARIALLQARANLATAQANLGRQVGVDAPVRAVPDTALPTLPDTAALRAYPLETVPQVLEADALERAAGADLWSRRSLYIPTLSVAYSNNHQGTGFPRFFGFSTYSETFNWRFLVSWTLFNGFTRESQVTQAAVARDNAVARAADARRQVSAEMTQQFAALTTAFEQIDIARANLAAATEDLRVQQERYRVGAATILELLTSQASLAQAEVNLVQTRFNYFIARAELEALIGRAL